MGIEEWAWLPAAITLNGVKVGDGVLAPLRTNYRKTVFYVRVEAGGFRWLQRSKVALSAGARLSLGEIQFVIGAVTETVNVVAQGAAVQAASAGPSAMLTPDQMTLNGLVSKDIGTPSVFSASIGIDATGEVKALLNNYQAEHSSNTGGGQPSGNQVNARFGHVTSTRNFRIMQLALRFPFRAARNLGVHLRV